jgi:error-prone DNA polymerase
MTPAEEIVADYQTTRLSLKGHPMQFLRGILDGEGDKLRRCQQRP